MYLTFSQVLLVSDKKPNLDANETFCVIPDTWSEDDAMIAKGWR